MRRTPTLLGRGPTRRRNVEREQFINSPTVSGDGSRHGGRLGRQDSGHGTREARMIGAEVVDRTDQIPPRLQRGGASGQGPAPASKRGQALAEGGVESFNGGGVDYALAPLRAAAPLFDLSCGAGHNAPLGTD